MTNPDPAIDVLVHRPTEDLSRLPSDIPTEPRRPFIPLSPFKIVETFRALASALRNKYYALRNEKTDEKTTCVLRFRVVTEDADCYKRVIIAWASHLLWGVNVATLGYFHDRDGGVEPAPLAGDPLPIMDDDDVQLFVDADVNFDKEVVEDEDEGIVRNRFVGDSAQSSSSEIPDPPSSSMMEENEDVDVVDLDASAILSSSTLGAKFKVEDASEEEEGIPRRLIDVVLRFNMRDWLDPVPGSLTRRGKELKIYTGLIDKLVVRENQEFIDHFDEGYLGCLLSPSHAARLPDKVLKSLEAGATSAIPHFESIISYPYFVKTWKTVRFIEPKTDPDLREKYERLEDGPSWTVAGVVLPRSVVWYLLSFLPMEDLLETRAVNQYFRDVGNVVFYFRVRLKYDLLREILEVEEREEERRENERERRVKEREEERRGDEQEGEGEREDGKEGGEGEKREAEEKDGEGEEEREEGGEGRSENREGGEEEGEEGEHDPDRDRWKMVRYDEWNLALYLEIVSSLFEDVRKLQCFCNGTEYVSTPELLAKEGAHSPRILHVDEIGYQFVYPDPIRDTECAIVKPSCSPDIFRTSDGRQALKPLPDLKDKSVPNIYSVRPTRHRWIYIDSESLEMGQKLYCTEVDRVARDVYAEHVRNKGLTFDKRLADMNEELRELKLQMNAKKEGEKEEEGEGAKEGIIARRVEGIVDRVAEIQQAIARLDRRVNGEGVEEGGEGVGEGIASRVAKNQQAIEGIASRVAKNQQAIEGIASRVAKNQQAIEGIASRVAKNQQAIEGMVEGIIASRVEGIIAGQVEGIVGQVAEIQEAIARLDRRANEQEEGEGVGEGIANRVTKNQQAIERLGREIRQEFKEMKTFVMVLFAVAVLLSAVMFAFFK